MTEEEKTEEKESHPVDVYVGKQLRKLRSSLGLKQQQVAKMAGITFQQLQKYEKGHNRMASSRLHDIGKILGVKPEYFFTGIEEDEAVIAFYGAGNVKSVVDDGAIQIPDFQNNKETMALVRAYYNIKSTDKRKRISELVKALAKSLGDEVV